MHRIKVVGLVAFSLVLSGGLLLHESRSVRPTNPAGRNNSTGSSLKLGGAVMLAGDVTALGTTNMRISLSRG
jgi:hypothetical protein